MEIVLLIVAVVIGFIVLKVKKVSNEVTKEQQEFLAEKIPDAIADSLETGRSQTLHGGKWQWYDCTRLVKQMSNAEVYDRQCSAIFDIQGRKTLVTFTYQEEMAMIWVKAVYLDGAPTSEAVKHFFDVYKEMIEELSEFPQPLNQPLSVGRDFMDDLFKEHRVNKVFSSNFSITFSSANEAIPSIYQRFTLPEHCMEYLCTVSYKEDLQDVEVSIRPLVESDWEENERFLSSINQVHYKG